MRKSENGALSDRFLNLYIGNPHIKSSNLDEVDFLRFSLGIVGFKHHMGCTCSKTSHKLMWEYSPGRPDIISRLFFDGTPFHFFNCYIEILCLESTCTYRSCSFSVPDDLPIGVMMWLKRLPSFHMDNFREGVLYFLTSSYLPKYVNPFLPKIGYWSKNTIFISYWNLFKESGLHV